MEEYLFVVEDFMFSYGLSFLEASTNVQLIMDHWNIQLHCKIVDAAIKRHTHVDINILTMHRDLAESSQNLENYESISAIGRLSTRGNKANEQSCGWCP